MACYNSYLQELRALGYRLTPQRVLILDALFHNGDHMTVEEIFAFVNARNNRVNRSTIYRSLHFLTVRGLVTTLERGAGETLYGAVKETPHAHAVCQRCGSIMPVDAALLQNAISRLKAINGFEVMVGNVQLPGLCQTCARQSAPDAPTQPESEPHMSNKEDYTTDEWALLLRLLLESAGVVMAASPGGVVGETLATYEALNQLPAKYEGIELIQAIVAGMTDLTPEERKALESGESGLRSYEELKHDYLNQLRRVRFILAQKATPEEGSAYKEAVVYVAEQVANASKEGGFLFIGGTRYTEAEQALVQEMRDVLGLSPDESD